MSKFLSIIFLDLKIGPITENKNAKRVLLILIPRIKPMRKKKYIKID
tara:strand:+ start:119 stop:259 length:141 start_codon:yes stop_codon:yes gene_type:complete